MSTRITLLLAALIAAPALAQDKITFATNWKAQAAHGGFYQAVADGTYRKYGLEVTIQPGGSLREEEVIAPPDAAGMAMVFTGHRHFRH